MQNYRVTKRKLGEGHFGSVDLVMRLVDGEYVLCCCCCYTIFGERFYLCSSSSMLLGAKGGNTEGPFFRDANFDFQTRDFIIIVVTPQ